VLARHLISRDDAPAREGGPALLMVNDVAGNSRLLRSIEIFAQGSVDFAFILRDDPRHDGDIRLSHFTVMKHPAEFAMRFGIKGHEDHAGSVAIEAMDDSGCGKFPLHARREAILALRADARDAQQAWRFVQHEQVIVAEKDLDASGHPNNRSRASA
jgi:hypothetical protein